MQDLRYPIGEYKPVDEVTPAFVASCIADIEALPNQMRAAVAGLTEAQLATPYRPDGWTVRQVVHHVADSHLNSIIRFKWTLTEDNPTIKAYNQADWAVIPDVAVTPVALNLEFLKVLHRKWILMLNSMDIKDFDKTFVHPEYRHQYTLGWLIGLYAWHGKHHVAHITSLREREGW